MKVKFKYQEDAVIMVSPIYGDIIKGNQIEIRVSLDGKNYQTFKRSFDCKTIETNPEKRKREIAKMFGIKLIEIGNMIKDQALQGKTELITNAIGPELYYF